MTSSNERERSRLEADIEALLFASDTPLSASRLSALTGGSPAREIKEAVAELERFYREADRSFSIVEVAGGYQITTLPAYAGTVSALFKSRRKPKLSQAALETLAIVAYRQPISRLDIEAIRGVNCDGVLATLTERDLIAISGRGDAIGRPYLYSTTSTFLEYLGLKDYRELPVIEELERSLESLDLIPPPLRERTGEPEENDAPQESVPDGDSG
ncbi:MAG: SMC-Scp complex subunit ScpB [Candidatus Krumholzibacteria bacterium]|nr:SMC-Scp complex subunit ScpB [Candidatus Krumholzibacteria bacterium]